MSLFFSSTSTSVFIHKVPTQSRKLSKLHENVNLFLYLQEQFYINMDTQELTALREADSRKILVSQCALCCCWNSASIQNQQLNTIH